jgi:hypothetical protein
MKDDIYYFHQTPEDLAKDLIKLCPLEEGDKVLEPFKGEGAFYNNFPEYVDKEWCEIEEGRDYTAYEGQADWVITNPPFMVETQDGRKNSMFPILHHFSKVATKGIAFLANDRFISTLTPKRLGELEERGWCIHNVCVVNVKAWRGRYFFVIFKREPSCFYKHFSKTY